MQTRWMIGVSAVLIGLMLAPQEGLAATERVQRTVAPFSALQLDGNFVLRFRVGPVRSVGLSGNRYVIDNLMIGVDRGVLAIERPHGFDLPRDKTITLTITAPKLDAIDLHGLVHAEMDGLAGTSFTLTNAGAAAVTLSGAVGRFSIVSRGVASIDSTALKARDLTVRARGQARLRVYASHDATVTMYGEGRVDVLGHPALHTFKTLAYGVVSLE